MVIIVHENIIKEIALSVNIKEIVEGNITVDNSLNQLQKEINIKIEEWQ